MSVEVIAFVLCALACFTGHVAIVHSVVRKGSSLADSAVPRPRLMVELLWAVIPMIVLALVLTATWVAVRENVRPKADPIMRVAR